MMLFGPDPSPLLSSNSADPPTGFMLWLLNHWPEIFAAEVLLTPTVMWLHWQFGWTNIGKELLATAGFPIKKNSDLNGLE